MSSLYPPLALKLYGYSILFIVPGAMFVLASWYGLGEQ